MKIFLVSNDSFLAQEFMLAVSSKSYKVEIHEDGLIALEDMRQDIPQSILVDSDCGSINPHILLKLISRDSRFENSKIIYLSKNEIENESDFQKEYGIFKLLKRPVSNEQIVEAVI